MESGPATPRHRYTAVPLLVWLHAHENIRKLAALRITHLKKMDRLLIIRAQRAGIVDPHRASQSMLNLAKLHHRQASEPFFVVRVTLQTLFHDAKKEAYACSRTPTHQNLSSYATCLSNGHFKRRARRHWQNSITIFCLASCGLGRHDYIFYRIYYGGNYKNRV